MRELPARAADLENVMPKWLGSEDPFDVAFFESVKEFTGIDYKAGDRPPPNELMLDWKASE